MGDTLQSIDGKIVVGPNKYKDWIYKNKIKVPDREIPLENS